MISRANAFVNAIGKSCGRTRTAASDAAAARFARLSAPPAVSVDDSAAEDETRLAELESDLQPLLSHAATSTDDVFKGIVEYASYKLGCRHAEDAGLVIDRANKRRRGEQIPEHGDALRIEACSAAFHHDQKVFELLKPTDASDAAALAAAMVGQTTPLHAVVFNPHVYTPDELAEMERLGTLPESAVCTYDPEFVKKLAIDHQLLRAVDKSATDDGETPLQAAKFWRSKYVQVLRKLQGDDCDGSDDDRDDEDDDDCDGSDEEGDRTSE
jgi:hypothetical protein